jgi:hypothetical protein
MARSPFQGTFQPNARPTVATAPDAIVHINGEAEIAGCPQCSRRFDLNRYITSIQTDLSVDSVPGSANISLSVPRHAIDDFYFDGTPVITTMMEVEIYAKGHFLVEGMPQYYPIFWGLVTEVQDNYSSGEHTVSIHCADILKWWELCKTNINAAVTAAAGDQGRSLVGNVFAGSNAYDIIFTLASASFGDVLIGTGSIQNFIRDTTETNAALRDMALYWEKRFSKMRSNLVLYGTSGAAVRGDSLFQTYSKQPAAHAHIASAAIRAANGGVEGGQMFYDPSDEKVVSMKTDYSNSGPGGLMQAEYQTKLELANAAKESVGFEFFMDVTGDIVFKPPFYNLDVLSNKPISWVQDIDVIDWDFSESESEVVTQIVMQGDFNSTVQAGAAQEILPFTTVTDYHLLRKYGWRTQNYNAEFMTDPVRLFYHGLDVLDRINARRYRGNVSIPLRPELRLGFPIYLAPKDQIWYVSGISHSIQFGGRATTTLTLTSRRTKFIAPRGIGEIKLVSFGGEKITDNKEGAPTTFRYSSRQLQEKGVFQIKREGALELPANEAAFEGTGASNPATPLILRHPKTGRIVGYPNVTMVYSRPFSPSDIKKVAGQQTNAEVNARLPQSQQENAAKRREVYDQQQKEKFTASSSAVMHGKYLHNTYQYGVNAAGVFIYAHDASPGGGVIREALTLPVDNLQPVIQSDAKLANPQALIRPVSDERGFEVIGHYQYGRRVSLRDGRLIVNGPTDKAKIDLQLALSGDLASLLTAQSQGLTTVVTGYADPAAELAIMTPDDAQTAAAYPGSENSPNKRAPQFTEAGDEFIDDAPLGSQEQRGVFSSVEATQLSRALTLAEMAVKDGAMVADENCVCLTGRADLAFMGSGYQVNALTGGPSAPDLAALRAAAPVAYVSSGQVGSLRAAEEAINAQIAAVVNTIEAATPEEIPALSAEYDALTKQLADVMVKTDAAYDAHKKQADIQSQPIQVVSVAALESKVSLLDASIAQVQARVAELEQQGSSGARVQDAAKLDAEIAAATAEAKDFELQLGHAQPEAQAEIGAKLMAASDRVGQLQKQRTGAQSAAQSLILDVKDQLRQLQEQRALAQQDVLEQQSSRGSGGSIFTQSNKELISRVEDFLVKLYSSLDTAHQQHESAIRGDRMPESNYDFKFMHKAGISVPTRAPGDPSRPDIAPVSEFAPPFSAPDRYRLGDPNASVGAVQSNAEGIGNAWSKFSQDIQSNTQKRTATTEIGQDRASIARLTSAREQLIKQRDSSTVVIWANVQEQIDAMGSEIAKLEAQIATNEAKLQGIK